MNRRGRPDDHQPFEPTGHGTFDMELTPIDTDESPDGSTSDVVVECRDLLKVFRLDGAEVIALQGLELRVGPGERVGVVGASGSGKTTLLNILGGLDQPTAGTAVVAGQALSALDQRQRREYRAATVGFVWQQSSRNLLHHLTALENIELPRRAAGHRDARLRARELLARVGLPHCADRRPAALSGGEQQRVAIAVALANDPPLLLADEPTGELDTANAAAIYELLAELAEETSMAQLIVSHDPGLAQHVDRVVAIRDGRVTAERVQRGDDVEEFLAVDRYGRVQLSDPHLAALDHPGRVRATVDEASPAIRLEAAEGSTSPREADPR